MMINQPLALSHVVGQHYNQFWHFKGRYRIVKGSRASKKSKSSALWFILHLMEFPSSNLLVIRKTYRSLKDSCYTELKWAITRLNVSHLWKITESPLQLEFIPTRQKIYFRGLDDPLKVTSITVDVGSLCFMWIEEAYEITSEDDFNILDESIRGQVADGLFKQITLTFNPWNEHHWIKKRFFDPPPSPNVLALTTNYLCNEFLDDADLNLFHTMKVSNPRRYHVAGLGEWGIVDGLVFENWKEQSFQLESIKSIPNIKSAFGLDFGYTNDPTALWCGLVDLSAKHIYVFDELYQKALSNEDIYSQIATMGYQKERITADSAEPKSIDRLRNLGVCRILPARKGRDSINNGIDFIQGFQLIIHPSCVNFLTEISNYTWAVDSFGRKINTPTNEFNHLMDAMRYALESFAKGETFSFE